MQPDARTHVVVDTNIICAFLNAKTVYSQDLAERAHNLINSVVYLDWTPLQLYIPAFAVAEAQHVLDKYRFCRWSGPTKAQPSKRLTAREYASASEMLAGLMRFKSCVRVDILPEHIPAASLVSLISSKYQITRSSKNNVGPMSAADCLVAGVAIDLGVRVGTDRVVIVTDDRRMWRVLQRCRRLPDEKAKSMPLNRVASQIGVEWSRDIYPRSILLSRVSDTQLADVFGGWPLPNTTCEKTTTASLSVLQKESLWKMSLDIKAAGGPGPDSLPYTAELDRIQVDFARQHSVYLLRSDISKSLLSWRKNPHLRPGIYMVEKKSVT